MAFSIFDKWEAEYSQPFGGERYLRFFRREIFRSVKGSDNLISMPLTGVSVVRRFDGDYAVSIMPQDCYSYFSNGRTSGSILSLLFMLDLSLIDLGYEVKEPFVFPEEVLSEE